MDINPQSPTEQYDIIDEVEYPEQTDRYKLILSPTKRFFIIDLLSTKLIPKNE